MAELHTEITASNSQMIAVLNDTKRRTESFARETRQQLLLGGSSGGTNYSAWEDLNKGADKASSTAKEGFAGANKEAGGLKSTLMQIGKIGIGSLITAALVKLPGQASKARETLDNLNDEVRKLNATPEGLQLIQFMSKMSNVNFTKKKKALSRINSLVGKANSGDKGAIKLFESVGLDAKELESLKADEIYLRVAAAINQLQSATAQSGKASSFFGEKNGAEQLSIFRNNIEQMRKDFKGKPVITAEDLANFDELDSKSKKLFSSISASATKAFALITPTILGTIKAVEFLTSKLTDTLGILKKMSFVEADLIDKIANLVSGNNYDPTATVTAADINTFRRPPGASVVPNYLTKSEQQVVTIKVEADKNGLITALASSNSAKIIIDSAVQSVAAAAASATATGAN